MPLMKILFRNNKSKYNKELLSFLDDHLEVIVRKGNKIVFQIIEPKQESSLVKYKITNLPAMIFNNKPYMGVSDIKDVILNQCMKSKMKALKDDEQRVNEYMFDILKSGDNEERDEMKTALNKMTQAAMERQIPAKGQFGLPVQKKSSMENVPGQRKDNIKVHKQNMNREVQQKTVFTDDQDDQRLLQMLSQTEGGQDLTS